MRLQCVGIVAVLSFASAAFGDGCYIPERAIRKFPEIPAQRAVLAWKDGVETLLIASALDSEAQRLGWLIPVPAVPQTIEKGTPGALKTLSSCIQPRITHDLYLEIRAAILVAFVGNLLLGTLLFKRERFLDLLLLLILLLFFWALLLPASDAAGSASTKVANVLVEKTATVGSYDISILRPAKPDDLNAWLAENGFSTLPAVADEVVSDYVSQGWVFAAIKLSRTESGQNTPHPIKMVFPSPEAVYPLRLTALAGGSPRFEVFVIASDTASCDSLDEQFCDRFSRIAHGYGERYEGWDLFRGVATDQQIGHPEIRSLMWDHCVLTKFAGKIDADDMTTDLRFTWQSFTPFQQHLYTVSGATGFAFVIFLSLAGAWLFVSMLVCNKRIVCPGGRKWYFGKVLLPAFALIALGAAVWFVLAPKLHASEVEVSHMRRGYFAWIVHDRAKMLFAQNPDILQGSAEEIADLLLKNAGDVAGPGLKVEDSPGNFTVEKREDEVVIRAYDSIGAVRIWEFPLH